MMRYRAATISFLILQFLVPGIFLHGQESGSQRLDGGLTVGAYYYPWYEAAEAGKTGWMSQALRGRLKPQQLPGLGVYGSRDSKVIGEHIGQSVRAGLDFWAVSWWGPGKREDRAMLEHILTHPDAGKLKYALLYESTGRLGSMRAPRYDNLTGDFAYMKEHYFDQPAYLKIGGKPVVFLYLTRVYFRDRGLDQLAELRRQFPDVYLIGDDVFGGGYHERHARLWDAVTAYDIYGQSMQRMGATRAALEELRKNYENARKLANGVGTAFIPGIAPGYNDKAVREGHVGRARYFTDKEGSKEGDIFRAMIRDVAIPLADPRADRIVMITSFNEWYEDTQIEATAGGGATTAVDDSETGSFYTEGDRYADYGTLYLDILREAKEAMRAAVDGPMEPGKPLRAGGRTLTLEELDSLPFVDSAYTERFTFDAFDNPKLAALRERYRLDEVVAPGKDEFDRQVHLMDWTHRQFTRFGRPSTEARGALEILEAVGEGHRFFCTQYGQVLVSAAASLGWVNRPLALRRHRGANQRGGSTEHTTTEIWSNQFGKWVMLDPTSNLYVEKDGVPLNAWEIRQEWFHRDGRDLVFVVGKERRRHGKADLPVHLGTFEDFGDLTFDPDEPDKYGFIGYIPNNNLMDAGFDYARMFIVKDALCEGTSWHQRDLPADPAVDPYFPIGQAALSVVVEGADTFVSMKSLTPNFLRFEVRLDGGEWQTCSDRLQWDLHDGLNRLEARAVNRWEVKGPVSTATVNVEAGAPAIPDAGQAAVRPADEIFWAPTLEQAMAMASANSVPILVMGYSLVGDGSTYTKFGEDCASAVF